MNKPFEAYLANEAYASARKSRVARKKAADREMAREIAQANRQRYSIIVSTVSFLALAALVAIAVLLGRAKAAEPTGLNSTAQEAMWLPECEAAAERCATLIGEDYENALIEQALLEQARMIPGVTVSHYCICKECCGKGPSDPAYGITASGREATPYVSVAVDPDVIPLGSDVLVDYGDGEIHYYRADDTGSAISGNHIDLCVESHQEAINLGIKTATVYWVAHN